MDPLKIVQHPSLPWHFIATNADGRHAAFQAPVQYDTPESCADWAREYALDSDYAPEFVAFDSAEGIALVARALGVDESTVARAARGDLDS